MERNGLGGAVEESDGEEFADTAAQDRADEAEGGMGEGAHGERCVGGVELTELGAGAVGDDGGWQG